MKYSSRVKTVVMRANLRCVVLVLNVLGLARLAQAQLKLGKTSLAATIIHSECERKHGAAYKFVKSNKGYRFTKKRNGNVQMIPSLIGELESLIATMSIFPDG